jgi:hypothetical protein
VSTPERDDMQAAAEALMTALSLTEAEEVALQQAKIVTSVLDLLTEVLTNRSGRAVFDESYRDGQVDLVKRLYATIKHERGQ